jgi:hypothetical protein
MCITTIPTECIVAFHCQQWLRERATMLLYMYIACLVPREDLRRSNKRVVNRCSKTLHVPTPVSYEHSCLLGWARCTSVNGHRRFGTACFFTKTRRGLLLRLPEGLRSFNDRKMFALPLRQKQNFTQNSIFFRFQCFGVWISTVLPCTYVYIYIYKWSVDTCSEVEWSIVGWSAVKWSEVKWSEVKWSEVKWRSYLHIYISEVSTHVVKWSEI